MNKVWLAFFTIGIIINIIRIIFYKESIAVILLIMIIPGYIIQLGKVIKKWRNEDDL